MPSKNQSILLGAGITLVLILVQIFLGTQGGQAGQYLSILVCCLAAILGAGGAVWHYTTTHKLTLPAGPGAGIGAAATGLGYAGAYVIGEVLQLVGLLPSDAEMIERARDQMIDQGMDPAQVDQALQFGEMTSGFVGALIYLVILAIVGAIVGAIAASIFKRGEAEDFAV